MIFDWGLLVEKMHKLGTEPIADSREFEPLVEYFGDSLQSYGYLVPLDVETMQYLVDYWYSWCIEILQRKDRRSFCNCDKYALGEVLYDVM